MVLYLYFDEFGPCSFRKMDLTGIPDIISDLARNWSYIVLVFLNRPCALGKILQHLSPILFLAKLNDVHQNEAG
jgi:hypothetical protein